MGVTQQLPSRDRYVYPWEYMMDRLAVMMGGRAAERLVLNTATSGAEGDLKGATRMARKMVLDWGVTESLGPVALGGEDAPIFLGEEIGRPRTYSDETAREVDEEVRRILRRLPAGPPGTPRAGPPRRGLLEREDLRRGGFEITGLPPKTRRPSATGVEAAAGPAQFEWVRSSAWPRPHGACATASMAYRRLNRPSGLPGVVRTAAYHLAQRPEAAGWRSCLFSFFPLLFLIAVAPCSPGEGSTVRWSRRSATPSPSPRALIERTSGRRSPDRGPVTLLGLLYTLWSGSALC